MTYWSSEANWRSDESTQFQRLGFPGRYYGAVAVATTTTASFTGSMYGYGAVLLGNGSNTATTKIEIAGGATLNGNDLVVGTIYELSPKSIQATGGTVYAFKRQQ